MIRASVLLVLVALIIIVMWYWFVYREEKKRARDRAALIAANTPNARKQRELESAEAKYLDGQITIEGLDREIERIERKYDKP